MGDWLKLTEEDIVQAQRLARAAPILTGALKIETADLPPDAPAPRSQGHTIRITEDDLTAVAPQASTTDALSQLEQLMFNLVNAARDQHLPRWLGGRTLRWHAGVAAVARGHALDMQQRQFIDHNNPEGLGVARRLERYGLTYLACGENIGVVYGEAIGGERGIRDIHDAFMRQPRSLTNHRGNILNPIWTHVGIGAAHHPSGVLIITQNFTSMVGS